MAKLLIIDDETDVREFAANFFRKRKVLVDTAASAEESLVYLEKNTPDLILLDINMKGMDGIEALRRIKERDSDAKIIMVTGKDPKEEEAYQQCLNLGAIDYIHKPLELDELEHIILRYLPE